MPDQFLEFAAEMLRIMGHPQRLMIAQCLEAGEMNVSDLAQAIGCPQSSTSQHLKAMRMRGLLASRRQGNCVFYSILRPEIYKIIQCVRQGAEKDAGQATV